MRKNIIILRHAKTETIASGQDDSDRQLTPRGINDAGMMAGYMAENGIGAEKILCSSSARTRETASVMQLASVEYVEKLYLASANEILALLMKIPESVNSLMLIGHNPGLHELSIKLARNGDEALLHKLAAKFPTCALAVIAFDDKWHDVARARGTLARFVTPKMLESAA